MSCNRLQHFHIIFAEKMTIVRPSHTYQTVIPAAIGGWEEDTIIDRLKKGQEVVVHGDGTSLWTLTHSKDFAKGFMVLNYSVL